jgi:hypothetical protein
MFRFPRILVSSRRGNVHRAVGKSISTDAREFHFPKTSDYEDKTFEQVNFKTIYGMDNLPRTTQEKIDRKISFPVLQTEDDVNHYRCLYEAFTKGLSEDLSFDLFTKIFFNSIRLINLDKPIESNHKPGKIIGLLFNTEIEIMLDEVIEDQEIKEVTSDIISNSSGVINKGETNIQLQKSLCYFSQCQNEGQLSRYHCSSLLEPLLYFIQRSGIFGENIYGTLTQQNSVDTNWLLNQKILTEEENRKMLRAIRPDITICLESEGGLVTYLPIEVKTKIGHKEILKAALTQSVLQSIFSGAGIGILTDSKSSLMYEIKGSVIDKESNELTIKLKYKIVESDQLMLTESIMLLYFIEKLRRIHNCQLQGDSKASKLCSRILKKMKRSKYEQKVEMMSLYEDYLKHQQNKKTTSKHYKLVISNETARKLGNQQYWYDEDYSYQAYKLNHKDLIDSKIYIIEDQKETLLPKILEKTNEIIINVDDQIVNGEFEVKQNKAFSYDYWEFPGEFLKRIITRLEKAGVNNPFILNGFIRIETDDGFIISAGQCYISTENHKKIAELENISEIQSKIKKQIELYESVGIHFKKSPLEVEGCITLTDDGEVFLKPENLINSK